MLAHGLKLHIMEIAKPIINSFKAPHRQYYILLEEEKKLKEKSDAKRRAQLIAADIEKSRTKQKNLAKAIELMETECFQCMELARKKDDISCVIKGNRLKRRKSEESKKDMEAFKKQITELENRREK